jgi:hypothetical protein
MLRYASLGLVSCALTLACGGEELSVNESLTTNTWVVTSYRTGGSERIDAYEGCLKDDVYTFDQAGTAGVDLGAGACPDGAAGIYPHVAQGTWALAADGWLTMAFTSATRADCVLTFTSQTMGGGPLTFGFAQPCSNTVATMTLRPQ